MSKKERKEKILRACDLIKEQDEKETELTSIVAQSMQVGYEMGLMAERPQAAPAT